METLPSTCHRRCFGLESASVSREGLKIMGSGASSESHLYLCSACTNAFRSSVDERVACPQCGSYQLQTLADPGEPSTTVEDQVVVRAGHESSNGRGPSHSVRADGEDGAPQEPQSGFFDRLLGWSRLRSGTQALAARMDALLQLLSSFNPPMPAAAIFIQSLPRLVASQETIAVHPGCSICLDDYHIGEENLLKLTGCGHIFHEECVLPWFKRKNTCPSCRYPLPMEVEASHEDDYGDFLTQALARERYRESEFSDMLAAISERLPPPLTTLSELSSVADNELRAMLDRSGVEHQHCVRHHELVYLVYRTNRRNLRNQIRSRGEIPSLTEDVDFSTAMRRALGVGAEIRDLQRLTDDLRLQTRHLSMIRSNLTNGSYQHPQ